MTSANLQKVFCISSKSKSSYIKPLYNLPSRPAHSAGMAKKLHPIFQNVDQNFARFLTSIFRRFWVVLGCQVGVISGIFGGQDGLPRAMFTKNVIFEKTSAMLHGSTILEVGAPQDRPKTAPRGSWKAFFSFLKIVLSFVLFWMPFWSILASKMEPHSGGRLDVWGSGS
jgi:hypothetical protein